MQIRLQRLKWSLLLGAVAACSGCSGINASHSISPASFFLPGLVQEKAPASDPPVETARTPTEVLSSAAL